VAVWNDWRNLEDASPRDRAHISIELLREPKYLLTETRGVILSGIHR